MASSLETNKILAALLTAGIFASGAGVFSRILYHPTAPEEPAYLIEVAAEGHGGGGGEAPAEISVAALLAGADEAGGKSGAKKCAACHTFEEGGKNKLGPNLWGIMGRDIGSVPGFGYSAAMTGLEGDWDFEKINAFLAKPKDFAPGTKMSYAGMKSAEDRADLILYLRSLAADPLPLPEAEAVEEETTEEAKSAESETLDAAKAPADAAEKAEGVADAAVDAAADVVEEAANSTEQVAEAASDVVESAEETVAAVTETVTETATETTTETVEAVKDAASSVVDKVAETATEEADMVTETAGDAADSASETTEAAAGAATAAAEATLAAVSDAAETASDAASGDSEAGGLVAMISAGDLSKGEKISKKCKACHVFDEGGKNKLGPALWDVVGRDIASHEGYKYSGALQEMEGGWTYEKLDQFLAAPKKYVPGTKMVFAGVKKEEDRADLISYLRTLAAEPAPLADGG